MSEKTKNIIASIIAAIIVVAVNWVFTCAFVYLIVRCFGISFKLAHATGIWLISLYVKLLLK